MATNPLIALQAQVPDVGAAFSNALINVNRLNAFKSNRQEQPMRNRILDAQAQATEAAVPTDQAIFNQRERELISSLGIGAQQIIPDLQAGNIDSAKAKLQSRKASLIDQGLPTETTDQALELIDTDPATVLTNAQEAVNLAKSISRPGNNLQFGGQQTFKDDAGNLFFGTTRRSPNTGSIESVLAPIGNSPSSPQGSVSLVSNLGLTAGEQVEQKVDIQEAVGDVKVEQEVDKQARIETNKLKTEFKLKPQVAAAVEGAVSAVKADAKISQENRSNARALNLYNVAMSGLVSALGDTETGPFVGLTPAITANQQIADGAVAAMAPVLKQMFRAAGEGIFTDRDQALLLEMVPTRKDRRESITSKLSNIDAIVKAKLADPDEIPSQPPQSPKDVPRETNELDDVLIIDGEGFLVP